MTKKYVKERSNDQTYIGYNGHKLRINAFFFDYKQGDDFRGYKFMLSADVKDMSKAELFDLFYNWVNGRIHNLPIFVKYRYAETDKDRFRIGLSM